MRIAVLSDIHGNLRAVEAVLADVRMHSPDLVVNLGDHVSGPLQAAETAELLIGSGFLHIRGNHDRQLLDRPLEEMGPSDRAARPQLGRTHLEWLAALPPELTLEGDILLVHGSRASDLDYLLEEVGPHGVSLASPEKIRDKAGFKGALLLCGHTHIPRLVRLEGGLLIVNPGSVGLQAYSDSEPYPHAMETGSPHARYALLDRKQGQWSVAFRAVEYDWLAASEDANRAGRPDWAKALATGYSLR